MNTRRIMLASGSPRRRWLLQSAGFDVDVVSQNADETWPGGDAHAGAITIAERKLAQVAVPHDRVVVVADTIVLPQINGAFDVGEPLGKPRDADEGRRMLQLLNGREHRVITGFCLARGAERYRSSVLSRVWFRSLRAEEIDAYLATPEPYDKAGSYGIQGQGSSFIDRIEGSYTNIVGLPLPEVIKAWEAMVA